MCMKKVNDENFSIDLLNVPSFSQEQLAETFGAEEDAELTDEEYADIIEDLLDPIEQGELSMIIELVDVACDSPRKSEMFADECLNFITNSKNAKTRALHMKYQQQYLQYCQANKS